MTEKEAILEDEVTEVNTAEVTVEVVETIITGPPHRLIAAVVPKDQHRRKGVLYTKDCQCDPLSVLTVLHVQESLPLHKSEKNENVNVPETKIDDVANVKWNVGKRKRTCVCVKQKDEEDMKKMSFVLNVKNFAARERK